jgi:hypothetical protein
LLINDLMTLQCEPATSSIFNRYPHCASEWGSARHHYLVAVKQPSCLSQNSIQTVACERCRLRLRREHCEFHCHRGILKWMTTDLYCQASTRKIRMAEELTAISWVRYFELSTKFMIVLFAFICSTWPCKISK